MSKTNPFKAQKLSLAIASASLLSAIGGVAQAESGAADFSIEEIIVTAQKRSASLQDTPIAISAFGAEALEDLGVSTAADVGEYAPNVTITPSLASKFNIRMSIRGNGTAEPSLAVDPKVGIYLDGAYIARNSGAVFDVVDLERVEVLRGPQGTLWGKNTTGGAVNLVTAKPKGELGFKQQLSTGSDNLLKSVTTLDTPEFAGVSAKLSYVNKSYDGWANNTSGSGESELGREDTEAFRVALHWEANDNFSVDYAYDQTNGEAVAEPNQLSEVLGAQFAPIGLTIDTATGIGYAGNPFAAMVSQAEPDKRLEKLAVDGIGAEHVDISGHNLTLSWQVGDLELKSITSYREYDAIVESIDKDGTTVSGTLLDPLSGYTSPLFPVTTGNVPMFHSSNEKSQHQFSQEFQALGSALDDKLQYVIGLYHFEEKGKEQNPWDLTIYNPFASPNAALTLHIGNFYNIESSSDAIFGHFTYDVTDKLSLTLGLRYTEDTKELELLAEDPSLSTNHVAEEDWSKFTAGFTANYALNNDISLYAKVSEGYASGIFNPGTLNRAGATEADVVAPALNPVDPEETLAYEVGMKSMLWDNRLMLNLAAFYNDNSNLQATDLVNGVRISLNSGESTTTGLEADVVFKVTPQLTLNASYGYLDIDYDEDGREQIAASDTGTVGISYDFPAFSFGQLSARLDTTYTGGMGFSSSDLDTKADSRTIINGRISLEEIELGQGNLRLAVWGKNLADEEYIVHGANFSFYRAYTWGAPRSAGVDLTYEF